ncbi:stabilizer of axonemal microtubules 4-like isoform 1-T1 [Anomaloglossus baeobatrachus]|uniref:stabilizer of axonemal microtubules 4-like isoform X1 n=1 Tax=Anomaloglossus baeobatrachus TaxID=238106 RepID=UPI003F4F7D27
MSPGIRGNTRGSCDPLNFYCTNYNTSYGRPDVPAVRVLHAGSNSHRSTGYQSNFRPVVYYSPNLDRKDNPQMGLILRGNYTSITSRDFAPLNHVTGAEPLPHALYSPQSGFIRSNEVTNPKSRTVKSVHFDTRDHGSEVISGISPQHRPLLFVPQGKGSPEVENFQHGPSFMSTEYKTRFTPKACHRPGRSKTEIIGEMENSGFTEGSNLEPITHDPYSQYRVPKGYHRLMGHSITKTDFLPSYTLQGREALPALAGHSDRDSGFSRELDQVLRTNAPFNDFQPKDRNKNKDEVLGRTFVGKKETSGFSNNNLIYVRSEKEPPQQYLTNYNLRFYNPVPRGRDREGWTRGGIQKQLHTGFSVNNELHITGI